jgi:hypothetical protein
VWFHHRIQDDNTIVNSLVQALNGTVSVGFPKTDKSFDASESNGTKSGTLLVVAENVSTPKQISPIKFTPNSRIPLPLIPFQLTHVDASLLVGLGDVEDNSRLAAGAERSARF